HDCPREGRVWHKEYERHDCGTEAKCHFTCEVKGMFAVSKETGQSATTKATHTGCSVRNPSECPDRFDVEAASVVKIFGQPKEVKIPGGVTEEFGCDDAPGLAKAKKFEQGSALGAVLLRFRRLRGDEIETLPCDNP